MHTMTVTVRGTTGTELIEIDGQEYNVPVEPTTISTGFDHIAPLIYFINDGRDANGQDRNVVVESVDIDGIDIPLTHPDVRSFGNWDSSDQRCDVVRYGAGGWIHCNNGYIVVDDAWRTLTTPTEPIPIPVPPTTGECPQFGADDFQAFVADLGACGSLELLLEALGVEV